MVLRPRAGLLEPEQWRGRPPPPGLPRYRELTVWPAEAAATKTKQKAQPRVPYPKLLHWWTEVYLPNTRTRTSARMRIRSARTRRQLSRTTPPDSAHHADPPRCQRDPARVARSGATAKLRLRKSNEKSE